MVTPETFGIVPCVPEAEYDCVNDSDVRDYPRSMQYLAKKTKSLTPYLPVHSIAEKQLYLTCIPAYLGGGINSNSTLPDFAKFCFDWNRGALLKVGHPAYISPIPSVSATIFRKTRGQLESYFKVCQFFIKNRSIFGLSNERFFCTLMILHFGG